MEVVRMIDLNSNKSKKDSSTDSHMARKKQLSYFGFAQGASFFHLKVHFW